MRERWEQKYSVFQSYTLTLVLVGYIQSTIEYTLYTIEYTFFTIEFGDLLF